MGGAAGDSFSVRRSQVWGVRWQNCRQVASPWLFDREGEWGDSLGAPLRTRQPFLVSEALDCREAPAQQGRGLGRGRESNLCRTLRIRLDAKNYQEQTEITEADPLSLQGARCHVQSHCWLEPGPPPYSFQGPAGPRESLSSLRCVGSLTPSSGCSLLGGHQTWTFTSGLLLLTIAKFY